MTRSLAPSPAGTEEVVQLTADVGENRHVEVEVLAVGGETIRISGKCDDDGEDVGLAVEVGAHGAHVFLAGQSSKVAVQHHDEELIAMIAEPPRRSLVIDECAVGTTSPSPITFGGVGVMDTSLEPCEVATSSRRFVETEEKFVAPTRRMLSFRGGSASR